MNATSPYPVPADSRIRATILSAARDLAEARGWGAVRMADVAQAAGVSRQTVYNEFGGRQGLAEALVLAEIQSFAATVRRELFAHGADIRAAGRAAIYAVLEQASSSSLVRGILAGTGGTTDELLPYLTTRSEIVLALAGAVVQEWIAIHLPHIVAAEARLASESIIRLTVSHIVLPTTSSEVSAETLSTVWMRLLGADSGGLAVRSQ